LVNDSDVVPGGGEIGADAAADGAAAEDGDFSCHAFLLA